MLRLEFSVEFLDADGVTIGVGSCVLDHEEGSVHGEIEIMSVGIRDYLDIEVKIRPKHLRSDDDIERLFLRLADTKLIKVKIDWRRGTYSRTSKWLITKIEHGDSVLDLTLYGVPRS